MAYRRGQGVIPGSHRLFVNMPTAHQLWKDAMSWWELAPAAVSAFDVGWDNDMQKCASISIRRSRSDIGSRPWRDRRRERRTAAVLHHLTAHNVRERGAK